MSLLGLFDEIVVVDNGSVDGTQQIVREFKDAHDRGNTMVLCDYPFNVSRCGPEHASTPEDSVHSLAYYYNWALSQCTRRYVCKWDADMVVRREARRPFQEFLGRLDREDARAVFLKGETVYRDAAGGCFLAADESVTERRLFPYGSDTYYIKGEHFERLRLARGLRTDRYDSVVYYELKFVDEDEFSHWSTTQFPTPRKKKEWERFALLRGGGAIDHRFVPLPAGFLDDQGGERLRDETP
jgi:glycosyltransferase involved in cell wall biosynthesis